MMRGAHCETESAIYLFRQSHSRKGIPSAHMHRDSISDLATLGMWADPGSYAYADDHLVLAYEPSFVSFVGFGV